MKRWWGIRHLRWYYLDWRLTRWWLNMGQYYWLAVNPSDEAYLDAVWRGDA
jgi:hypothetical protein